MKCAEIFKLTPEEIQNAERMEAKRKEIRALMNGLSNLDAKNILNDVLRELHWRSIVTIEK